MKCASGFLLLVAEVLFLATFLASESLEGRRGPA